MIVFCVFFRQLTDTQKVTLSYLDSICEQPIKSNNIEDNVQKWYADFIDVDHDTHLAIMKAANYLDLKPLLDLTCGKVACMIKGRTLQQIRENFGYEDDYTEEEKEEFRNRVVWYDDEAEDNSD